MRDDLYAYLRIFVALLVRVATAFCFFFSRIELALCKFILYIGHVFFGISI